MMNSVIHPVTGKEMQYKDLMKDALLGPLFEIGLSNELGRICQGMRDIAGTNTAFFIELNSIPKDRKITYGKLVCDFKPNKTEKHRVRLTVGGDRLDYSGDIATSTADITTFVNHRSKNDDDGHKKLLLRHSIVNIRVHETPYHNPSTRHTRKI
jgi:hypothetical protein